MLQCSTLSGRYVAPCDFKHREVSEVLLFQVQPGDRADLQGVEELLTGTADMAPSMAAFTAAMEANSAFVMSCEGQVGLYLQPQADISQLSRCHHFVRLLSCVPGALVCCPHFKAQVH